MSARILGSVDVAGGLLLLVSQSHFGDYSIVALILGLLLIGKGLFSMV